MGEVLSKHSRALNDANGSTQPDRHNFHFDQLGPTIAVRDALDPKILERVT